MIYVYYILLVAAFLLSLRELRYRAIRYLSLLLLLSIVTELVVEVFDKHDTAMYLAYHLFTFFEYGLCTLVLREFVRRPLIRQLMGWSIIAFTLLAVAIIWSLRHQTRYPSITGQIEGTWIVLWCLIVFLSIEPDEYRSIYQHPEFWIALGFFVYSSGTLCFNGLYNSMLRTNDPKAREMYAVFNSIFNYLLYGSLSIGILAYRWKWKSSPPP